MKTNLFLYAILLLLFRVSSVDPQAQVEHQSLLPLPGTIPSPPDNPITPEKVAIGKRLFFDPILSGNNQMSCATCHDPEKAFGDGLPTAKGLDGKVLMRNTQTIMNVAWIETLFWDGRAGSLEEQALIPIQSPDEMNQDMDILIEELKKDDQYSIEFASVFGDGITIKNIQRALAAYQRTLVTPDSPFDRFLAGNVNALTDTAKEGLELFQGSAGCIRCHNGPLLSDGKFYRIGFGFQDKGRGDVTGNEDDWYKFRTPSLRNVARTAPYMHDGSIKTLFEAVEFYFRHVPASGSGELPLDVEPMLSNSYSDIFAIVEFLKSLNGNVPE